LARLLPARLSFSRVESSVLPQSIDAGRCSPGSQVRFPLYLPVDGCLPLLGPDPAAADQWRLPAAEAARKKKQHLPRPPPPGTKSAAVLSLVVPFYLYSAFCTDQISSTNKHIRIFQCSSYSRTADFLTNTIADETMVPNT